MLMDDGVMACRRSHGDAAAREIRASSVFFVAPAHAKKQDELAPGAVFFVAPARVRQLQGGKRRFEFLGVLLIVRNGYEVMQWVVVFDDGAVVMD